MRLHASLVVLLGIVLITNLYLASDMNLQIATVKEDAKNAAEPAEISLYSIVEASCSKCATLDSLVAGITKRNVKVLGQEVLQRTDAKAQELIKTYGVTSLPALIVTGDVDKSGAMGLTRKDDALVSQPASPPYADAQTGATRGLVSVTLLEDSSCEKCASLANVVTSLESAGVVIDKNEKLDIASSKGKGLIRLYDVQTVPTIVLSGDVDLYEDISSALLEVGTLEDDGAYVIRTASAPFRNLSDDSIAGLVDVTYLVDASCEECYDPTVIHQGILKRMGMTLSSESSVDVASVQGKEFVALYELTQVPTVIIGKQASAYALFSSIWKQVGTQEEDGSFIFRRNDALGGMKYRDLKTGEILGQEEQEEEQ